MRLASVWEVDNPPKRVLAVLPALNEAETVTEVIAEIRTVIGCDVLVIDDGSTDGTASVCRTVGATVVTHPFNLGVGAAIRTGLLYADHLGYDVVIQIDADGQHEVRSALDLIEPAGSGSADLVLGSRFAKGYKVSGFRSLGMQLLSRVVSRRIGVRVTDTTSGFRAFGPKAIDSFAQIYPTEYLSDTVEALLIAHDLGFTVEERPVTMHHRKGGKASAGWFRSSYMMTRLLLVIALHPLRRSNTRGVRA